LVFRNEITLHCKAATLNPVGVWTRTAAYWRLYGDTIEVLTPTTISCRAISCLPGPAALGEFLVAKSAAGPTNCVNGKPPSRLCCHFSHGMRELFSSAELAKLAPSGLMQTVAAWRSS